MPIKNLKAKKARKVTIKAIVGNKDANSSMPSRFGAWEAFISFLEGYGSILDFFLESPFPNRHPVISDAESLQGDWERVGRDLIVATNKFNKSYGKN